MAVLHVTERQDDQKEQARCRGAPVERLLWHGTAIDALDNI